MHHEDETVVKYSETEELIFEEKRKKNHYWMDETRCVRRYAGDDAGCIKQAIEQEYVNY